MNVTITPFLLFDGSAQEAMLFYTSIFPNSRILQTTKRQTDTKGGKDGIEKAVFSLNGHEFMCGDAVRDSGTDSTPNFFIDIGCGTMGQLQNLFNALSTEGKILKPLDSANEDEYFGQVLDRFGVAWQLHAPKHRGEYTEGNVCFADSKEVRPEYRD